MMVFAFDGLTFLFSAGCLLMIRMPIVTYNDQQKSTPDVKKMAGVRGIIADIQEGIGYVRQVPWLGMGIVLFAIVTTGTASALIVALPKLVQNHYKTGVWLLGTIFTVQALGFILAMLLIGYIHRHRGIFVFATAVLLCIGVIGLGLPIPFLMQPLSAIGASLLIGLNGGLNDTLWNALQQEHVPSDKLGRVSSINMLSSFCLWPLGYVIVGKAADTIDPSWVFVITGCIGVVLYSYALCRRSIRQLE